jgi:hypothetical protein
MNNKLHGAQVTEAHRELACTLTGRHYSISEAAELIADSEALACAELRAEVRAVLKIVNEQTARAESAEREVERLRLETARIGKNGAEEYIRAERAEAKLKSLVDSF